MKPIADRLREDRRKAQQQNWIGYPRGLVSAALKEIKRLTASRNAWEAWANHIDGCRDCGEAMYCPDGKPLKRAAESSSNEETKMTEEWKGTYVGANKTVVVPALLRRINGVFYIYKTDVPGTPETHFWMRRSEAVTWLKKHGHSLPPDLRY